MDNIQEEIIRLFKSGMTIKGLTDYVNTKFKQQESTKKLSERIKINRAEAMQLVEYTICLEYSKNMWHILLEPKSLSN